MRMMSRQNPTNVSDESGVSVLAADTVPAQATGGIGLLTIGNFAAQATRLLFSIIVAQALGPAGRGAVALIGVIDEVSTAIFTIGVPIATGYYAKIKRNSDQELVNAGLRFGVLLLPLTTAVGVAVGVGALAPLEPVARWLTVLLIAWTGVVNLPGQVAMNLLQAHRKLKELAINRVIFNFVSLAVVAVLTAAGHLSVTWVAVAFVLGRLGTSLYTLTVTVWPSRGPAAAIRPLVSYGRRAVVGSIGTLLNNRVDQLVIAPMVGLTQLGYYAVAAGTSFLPIAVAMSMAVSAFSLVSHDSALGRAASTATAIRRGLLVSGVLAAGLAAMSPVLIPLLYGSDFKAAVVPSVILLVGSIPWGGQLVASQCAYALGYPSFVSVSELIGLCVTVIGLIMVVPLEGIIGAAFVSVFAYTLRLAITLTMLRRVGLRGFVPGGDDLRWLYRRSRRLVRRSVRWS
jgi:O-antigen/teichoic acid export membrane protein